MAQNADSVDSQTQQRSRASAGVQAGTGNAEPADPKATVWLKPEQVTPHTLRHSVAYRMLNRERGNTLYDVTKRLRHATIQTTERVYSHFDRV